MLWERFEWMKPLLLIGFVVVLLGPGCAKTPDQVAKKTDSEQALSTPESTSEETVQSDHKLVGVWLGEATLDEQQLQSRLDQSDRNEQAALIAKARSFLSTLMAIEFKGDGSIENEVELVTTEGKLIRDVSTGAWRLVESVGDEIVVETQENLSDGSISTLQNRYRFEDVDQFVLNVPMEDELSNCGAKLIFRRQHLPPASVAEGASETQTR